jgi:hypothetical protein
MRKNEIEGWVNSLVAVYGKPQPAVDTSSARLSFMRKKYGDMVKTVVRSMRLNMSIRIGYVSSGGPGDAPAWVRLPAELPMFGTDNFKKWTMKLFIRKEFLEQAPFEAVVFVLAHEAAHVVLSSTRHPLARVEEVVDLTAMLLGYRDVVVSGAQYITMPKFDLRKILPTWNMDFSSSRIEDMLIPEVNLSDKLVPQSESLGYMSAEEYRFARELMLRRC